MQFFYNNFKNLLLDDTFNGYHYIAVNERLNHTAAVDKCLSLGANIASILSDEEDFFIRRLMSEEYCGEG